MAVILITKNYHDVLIALAQDEDISVRYYVGCSEDLPDEAVRILWKDAKTRNALIDYCENPLVSKLQAQEHRH